MILVGLFSGNDSATVSRIKTLTTARCHAACISQVSFVPFDSRFSDLKSLQVKMGNSVTKAVLDQGYNKKIDKLNLNVVPWILMIV